MTHFGVIFGPDRPKTTRGNYRGWAAKRGKKLGLCDFSGKFPQKVNFVHFFEGSFRKSHKVPTLGLRKIRENFSDFPGKMALFSTLEKVCRVPGFFQGLAIFDRGSGVI